MVIPLGLLASPEQTVGTHRHESGILWFEFDHQWGEPNDAPLRLTVFVEPQSMQCLFPTVTPRRDEVLACDTLARLSRLLDQPIVDLRAPLPLAGLTIDKPWGHEIWFTGIESRGVCTAAGVPLPWLLDCFPETMTGQTQAEAPILLKVLSPFPDEDLGDLYFEAHARKTEVYIVTGIDRQAWPDGIGKIRFGFDQQRRQSASSDDAFRADYLKAVSRYREIRDRIDRALPDYPGPELPDVDARRRDLGGIDPQLIAQEKRRRRQMESFYGSRDLRVGDVIRVPPLTPHSLQHGVTVVEFQTPHYERFILSFSQKVLTQPHWDTEQALGLIPLDAALSVDQAIDQANHGERRNELIADFDAFRVLRLQIEPGETRQIVLSAYALVMCITGEIEIQDRIIGTGSCALVPASCPLSIDNRRPTAALAMIALPGINPAADP